MKLILAAIEEMLVDKIFNDFMKRGDEREKMFWYATSKGVVKYINTIEIKVDILVIEIDKWGKVYLKKIQLEKEMRRKEEDTCICTQDCCVCSSADGCPQSIF